jgi:hypothetical protein
VIERDKEGRTVRNRVDAEALLVADAGGNHRVQIATPGELEKSFLLTAIAATRSSSTQR